MDVSVTACKDALVTRFTGFITSNLRMRSTVLPDLETIFKDNAATEGFRSEYPDYPKQGRAGKGVKAGVFNSKTGKLVALKVLPPEMDVMIITNGGIIIRMVADEISKFGRDTQGVKVMRLKADELISSVTLTPHEEEEEEQTESDDFISTPEEVDVSQDSIPTETPSTPQTDKPHEDEE